MKEIIKSIKNTKAFRFINYFILSLIVLSVLSIMIESVQHLDENVKQLLKIFNIFVVIVFSIEFIWRIYISYWTHPTNSRIKSALKFIFSVYGIIDLLAILPFYLPMVIKIDLRFLRILRFIRVFRILKFNRYNRSLSLIWAVLKEKKSELFVTVFLTFLLLVLASFAMYYIEGNVQPDAFPNIFATLWWTVATLTTIGYGDVYPVTAIGKLLSAIIANSGIGSLLCLLV